MPDRVPASSEPRPENPPVSPTPEERNPYAPSADWKPGQDTFTSQAAGIWAEGFAAGRAAFDAVVAERDEAVKKLGIAIDVTHEFEDEKIALADRLAKWERGEWPSTAAANPDLPKDERRPWPIAPDTVMPPHRQPVRWGSRADDPPTEIHDDPEKTKAYLAGLAAGRTEARAASPDERLREAAREFNEHPNASGKAHTAGIVSTLIGEESAELIEALEDDGDRAHIARELADVVYVAYTAAWAYDIDLDAALVEIHRAAMDKVRANVRRESDGKIIKPPGFVPPDMSAALAATDREKPETDT